MSSCSSDFDDCSEKSIAKMSQSKKKWKKRKGTSCKKDYLKIPEKSKKPKIFGIHNKKLSTKIRGTDRINKSIDTSFSELKIIDNDNGNIFPLNGNNTNDHFPPLTNDNIITGKLFAKDTSTEPDDSDKNERLRYITLLSKLIDLNMPSKIESNRSNEAYSKRQCFLERRRYDSDKNETCELVFCNEPFWFELQERVNARKADQIKDMKTRTIELFKEFISFKVIDNNPNISDVPKDKSYGISKSYLGKIKLAYDRISELLGNYYHSLSFWMTTRAMEKNLFENNLNYIDHYRQIIDNIETMQAWQNCCLWLNWKTRQICQLVGITGNALQDFIIAGYQHVHGNDQYYDDDNGVEFGLDIKNTDPEDNGEITIQIADRAKVRSYSLNMDIDYSNPPSLINNTSNVEMIADNDYESKFEIYADINRRRYGLEKVCCSAIDSVKTILQKYQSLFSITKDENTLPLMQTYAEALKEGKNAPMSFNNHNGSQLIFTETLSEASGSSYQTARPAFEDSIEFPSIHSSQLQMHHCASPISPSLSSHPSFCRSVAPPMEDLTPICDGSLQLAMDLRKRWDNHDQTIIGSREFDMYRDSKGLFGLRNQVAARLCLPPLLPHYLFLARFPIKIMHCCIKRILCSPDISRISELSVLTIKQRIIDYKDALQFTMKAREFLFNCAFGINFQIYKYVASSSKDFAPKQDIDLPDFMSSSMKEIDGDLSSLLRYYIDCLRELLKKWSRSPISCKFEHGEPRKLLEEEWNFVKTYCHSIKQEEEFVASSFCSLAEYLFDLLQSRIKSDYNLCINVETTGSNNSSPLSSVEDDLFSVSSNRRMSKNCQSYNNECKMVQSQLKQAADFAKMLRSDLEISIQLELSINYSMNDLLSFLNATRHKMIDLCSLDEQPEPNGVDLTLIIPDESSPFIKELLDPLITGFSFKSKEDQLRISGLLNSSSSKIQRVAIPREYILIINKKSKINWPGEKIKFIYQLDIGNLKQRIESSNIVFLARRPDELMEQLSLLLEFQIPCKTGLIQFKNVIQSCSEGQIEACHYNSKRTLNALKSKAIEVSQTLLRSFIYEENELFKLNKIQEETMRNSIKNSYSITFEFYRDLIKLCTGDAFKTTLKNTVIALLDKWFQFSRRFEPSDKGTVPRWSNDGLNFLLQLCQSRVAMNMTKKEWNDFKTNIDNFVEFIVGKSKYPKSTPSGGRSTTTSSKVVTNRSRSHISKPDIIRGCENNSSNTKKIETWDTNCDNRTLRSAFSEPSRMQNSDQHLYPNRIDRHLDLTKVDTNFTEIVFSRSITVQDPSIDYSRDLANSNKSTDGSSNADLKDRRREAMKQAIEELERQLSEKRRENKLMGFVRESYGTNTSFCYIKKAPFQWIKKGQIGQGRAGTVYKVCNIDTLEVMAMKEIVINEPLSQDFIECDLLSKLSNPSLLKYYGVDISLSHMRIFTEYCESGSLSQVSILDIPEINLRQWTKQVLEAIVHLHSHNIVHRDVKPDNIFLKNIEDTNECHAKLGDFGVAKYINSRDGLRDVKGTVMYMAPEVVVADSEKKKSKIGYNHKVDIWSLGCLVLYMITGKNPWDESHQLTIYYNLGMNKTPFIPSVDSTPRMTQEARDFIINCLNIEPDQRPESMDLLSYNFVKLGHL